MGMYKDIVRVEKIDERDMEMLGKVQNHMTGRYEKEEVFPISHQPHCRA